MQNFDKCFLQNGQTNLCKKTTTYFRQKIYDLTISVPLRQKARLSKTGQEYQVNNMNFSVNYFFVSGNRKN